MKKYISEKIGNKRLNFVIFLIYFLTYFLSWDFNCSRKRVFHHWPYTFSYIMIRTHSRTKFYHPAPITQLHYYISIMWRIQILKTSWYIYKCQQFLLNKNFSPQKHMFDQFTKVFWAHFSTCRITVDNCICSKIENCWKQTWNKHNFSVYCILFPAHKIEMHKIYYTVINHNFAFSQI